ncbi:MAG TPA: HlyD family secretion protein, partial [Afifellaceae bacterium]|nr:HlyD family secretion protein [Afifellaceae bacterium]
VSLVALWRYSWWFDHARRARRYGRWFFPRLRARADALSDKRPPHLCVLTTSHLNGAGTALNDITENAKPQRAVTTRPHPANNRKAVGRFRKAVGHVFWTLFAVFLAGLLGLALFNRIFTVTSASAAVTAPANEIRAPASGLVDSRGIRPGDRVSRDQELLFTDDPNLAFDLQQARAAADMAVVPGIVDHSERLASARLNALETRLANNVVYSPCDCIVHEIIGANGGKWAETGQRLMALIPNRPGTILVDARIAASDASRLSKDQHVVLTFPMTGETVHGSIETVVTQPGGAKRVGTPGWYARDDGHVSALVRPRAALSPSVVGQPAEMTTAYLTLRGLWNHAGHYAARLRNLAGFSQGGLRR